MKSNSPNICPRCGAEFHCGMNDEQKACWCASLPPLNETRPGAGCYCPDCLRQLVAQTQTRAPVALQEQETPNS
ncbi:MAG: cysteine-rich CWC family protein [Proteobacteria bacterium]|nr:cysteine-rich CWC family protein [Pseudomonadota bacterium]